VVPYFIKLLCAQHALPARLSALPSYLHGIKGLWPLRTVVLRPRSGSSDNLVAYALYLPQVVLVSDLGVVLVLHVHVRQGSLHCSVFLPEIDPTGSLLYACLFHPVVGTCASEVQWTFQDEQVEGSHTTDRDDWTHSRRAAAACVSFQL
jgi:hypothetical protein